MEKKLPCQEVFEAVVTAVRGTERGEFLVSGNSQSLSPSADRYQETL